MPFVDRLISTLMYVYSNILIDSNHNLFNTFPVHRRNVVPSYQYMYVIFYCLNREQ